MTAELMVLPPHDDQAMFSPSPGRSELAKILSVLNFKLNFLTRMLQNGLSLSKRLVGQMLGPFLSAFAGGL